jgi:hypothetical protein
MRLLMQQLAHSPEALGAKPYQDNIREALRAASALQLSPSPAHGYWSRRL